MTNVRSGLGGLDRCFADGDGHDGSDAPAVGRDEGDGAVCGGVVDDVRELGAHFASAEVLSRVGHDPSVPMRNLEYTRVHKCHSLDQTEVPGMSDPLASNGADHHDKCHHKRYALTCSQLDALLIEANGRCQVCSLPAADNAKQMLFIDHDGWLGNWAVRGLLCNTCNTLLGKDLDVPRDAVFAAYLENAWYVRMLATLGFVPDLPAEPPVGSVVDFGGRQPRRMRVDKGWIRETRGHPWTTRTWRQLYRSYGPHRLRVVRMGDGKPLKQRRNK